MKNLFLNVKITHILTLWIFKVLGVKNYVMSESVGKYSVIEQDVQLINSHQQMHQNKFVLVHLLVWVDQFYKNARWI
jgi:hypothetical protein